MKLTTVIPYWESKIEKRKVLQDCINSFQGQQDELIILAGKQPSLPNAWNQCIELAFGMGSEYVCVSNDDVILDKGSLGDLCVPYQVVSPTVNGGVFKVFHAHIWVMSKSVWEKVGKFDEKFNLYWSDTDWIARAKQLKVPVGINYGVNVKHLDPGQTMRAYPGSLQSVDRDYFVEKWGREIFDPVTDENL